MKDAWRIDSLDTRAGLAFASWRMADLDTADPRLDYRTVFLAPPAFRPEVASRATALSAARGYAQLGVFVDEAELAFDELEALIEFVRRLYLSGGGGDGGVAGGGGGRPVPRRPELGLEFAEPESPTGESSRAWDLLAAAGDAVQIALSLTLPPHAPTPTARFQVKLPGGALPSAGRALADGAAELLLELLRRYPKPQPAANHLEWWDAARRLGAAIGALGLWEELLSGPARAALDKVAPLVAESLDVSGPTDRWLIALLVDPEIGLYEWREPQLAVRLKLYGGYPLTARAATGASDPVEDLCLWPLASALADSVGAPGIAGNRRLTAYHLLSATLAAPGKLLAAPGARAASVMLFAAAHMRAAVAPPFGATSLGAQTDAHARTEHDAMSWIARQWPALIFPPPVEAVISGASAIADG